MNWIFCSFINVVWSLVLKMEKTMMRILSVLANPNGINVLVSGDLLSAFNIMETSTPTNAVDAVIHFFCKLSSGSSQPSAVIQPIFKFLSSKQLLLCHCLCAVYSYSSANLLLAEYSCFLLCLILNP